jgi:hypothetical protein
MPSGRRRPNPGKHTGLIRGWLCTSTRTCGLTHAVTRSEDLFLRRLDSHVALCKVPEDENADLSPNCIQMCGKKAFDSEAQIRLS